MSRILVMVALVVAGEQVFGLAFHTQRFFRSTMLETFGFTNTELGDLFIPYGVAAMFAYFPGGVVADRFSARSMLTLSLLATAVGGLYMATFPGRTGMLILYAYWGVTTIFLFWAALIKATRDWGGENTQGQAFGILEGGRGAAAALIAALAVSIFAFLMPENVRGASIEETRASFRVVILLYSFITLLAAALTWFAIPPDAKGVDVEYNPIRNISVVIRRPVVWATAAMIICAYCGYKGLDQYNIYATTVLGKNQVEAAQLVTWGAYTRVFAAILAGIIADRFGATRTLGVIFAIMSLSYGAWSLLVPDDGMLPLIFLNFFLTYIVVFALRGIYFALLEENSTPKFLTGAAVGMISLFAYTPDIFFAPIAGRILDANPGVVGFQHYFWFLGSVAAVGVALIFAIVIMQRKGAEAMWPEVAPDSNEAK